MQNKVIVVCLMGLLVSGLARGGEVKKISEEELLKNRLKTYNLFLKKSNDLEHCWVRTEGARGDKIYFPRNRHDIILRHSDGRYFAVKVTGSNVKLLWSLCSADDKRSLDKSQHKSLLWKGIAKDSEMEYQVGKFPSEFENGYDIFWADRHSGEAARVDKNGRTVCSYENVNTGDPYLNADAKITKLCKP